MRAEDVLPDNMSEARFGGVTIRKGSVAAFLANAAALENTSLTEEARATALRDIEEGLPALRALGLFDLLQVRNPELRALVEGPGGAQAPAPTPPPPPISERRSS